MEIVVTALRGCIKNSVIEGMVEWFKVLKNIVRL